MLLIDNREPEHIQALLADDTKVVLLGPGYWYTSCHERCDESQCHLWVSLMHALSDFCAHVKDRGNIFTGDILDGYICSEFRPARRRCRSCEFQGEGDATDR